MGEGVNSVLSVIKDHLKERDIKISAIAEKFETSSATISRLLNGQTKFDMVDFETFSKALGIPMSALLREAEAKNSMVRISEDLERFLCGDTRRYVVFTVMNDAVTIEEVSSRFKISKVIVKETIDRLVDEGIVFQPKQGMYRLSDIGKNTKFGRLEEFYNLKAKLYTLQNSDTYKNLSRDSEYWATKEDQMLVAKLTSSQIQAIVKHVEVMRGQIIAMDDMNEHARTGDGIQSETQLHMLHVSFKPLTDGLLRGLTEVAGDK